MRLLVLVLVLIAAAEGAESARKLARKAAKAEKAGRLAEAVLLYNQAASRKPKEARYPAKSQELTARLLRESELQSPASAAPAPPPADDAVPAPSTITEDDLQEARHLLPPPELAPGPGPYAIHEKLDQRRLIETAASRLGFQVQFDEDFPQGGAAVRFDIESNDYREILEATAAATGSFFVTLGPKRLLAVKDTQQKRLEREPTVAIVLSLPDPVTVQEVQELARSVQQTMELQKFAVDSNRRLVLVRDRISKVRPAQQLFEQLLGARPVIGIEVEVYELSAARTLNAGVRLPTSTSLFSLSRILNNEPAVPEGAQVATFGGGNTLIGMTLSDADVVASMLRSLASKRQRIEVRTSQGMPAQVLFGQRYPILTAGYFGEVQEGDPVFTPPPSFQFENLGVSLKVTPYAHGMDEITIEVDAEFKVLTGAQLNGIPVLANRKVTSTLRMRNGEWGLVAGLNQSSRSQTATGYPGLMRIPLIGPLFRSNSIELRENDNVVLIKPRLLSLPASETTPQGIRLGGEGRPLLPM